FGAPAEEIVGRTVSELLGPDAFARVEPYLERGLAGETVSFEEQLPYTVGERYIWATYAPDMDPSGLVRGVVTLVTDTTERRALEEKMRASQRMEAVGRLAGGVAHEVNNALTSVMGFADLLLAGLASEDPRVNDVELIHSSARRAAQITQQLLAYSRRQILLPSLVDLREIVRDFEPMIRQAIGRSSELHFVIPDEGALVMTDRLQMEQVLLNLALNARDAMPNGGTLEIAIRGPSGDEDGEHADDRVVELSVTDTGTGMDPEVCTQIFEPFFTTKPVGRGTGLGLSMVYGIVQQSGGHITVQSERGRGTTFRIQLPEARSEP
ncbi:MAG: PAS domain-containing protein, partial [Polyangiaceae bacterium]|nr:PAS domain-containing protein [Polyangiaceae bacterium]